MDDTEDDAGYPPNPHRHPFSSSHRPKRSFPQPVRRNYDDSDDEDEPDGMDGDSDDRGGEQHGVRGDVESDSGSGSSESRGKRRRLDKLALGFEFAPRAAPPKPAPPHARSPADWSEGSTFALLEAWGGLFLQNGRKSLRSDEWGEVARRVSRSSKTPRSDAQCRNRLDTLKKKYKKEKARMADSVSATASSWVYFDKMDSLMSSPPPPPAEQLQTPRLPCGVDAGEYVFASSRVYVNRSNGQDEMRDSPGDTGSDEDNKQEEEEEEEEEEENDSDGLPPMKEGSSSFRMLADSIQRFGEIYEKMESHKRQQIAELERMRKEFQRDLETQKKQILERAHAEIAKIRQEEGEGEEEEEEEAEDEEDEDEDEDGDDEEEDEM